jgi:SAM-dependent methyltransferase
VDQVNYLLANDSYWKNEYTADNVDHVDHTVFRSAGRILKPDFNLPNNHEKLLDFGCGTGAAVNYYNKLGFEAFGVDSSATAIIKAKSRYPNISDNFLQINMNPFMNHEHYVAKKYTVVTAFQSLYYFDKLHFHEVVRSLHKMLEPGGVFIATMMSRLSAQFYLNSQNTKDSYLREVNFSDKRQKIEKYFMSFIEDEDDLKNKFDLFKPVHIGYYSAKFRSDEGDGHHYIFCGTKK